MEKTKKFWSLLTLVVGFVVVLELMNIYYNVNILGSKDASFCHINDLIDCDGVSQTKYAQVFGVPLCGWGFLFYCFVAFLTLIEEIKSVPQFEFAKVFKNPSSYIYSLGLVSLVVSVILAGVQIFDIKKLCVLCFATYFVDLALVLINHTKGKGLLYDVKVSINDFLDAIKIKKYAIAFCTVIFLGICTLAYTTFSYVLTPQVKRQNSFNKIREMKSADFPVYGNKLGEDDAKVLAVEFSDFQCPFCSLYNTVIQKIMTSGHISNVKVIHKNFPLDATCNKYLKETMHQQACMLAKYAIAAEKQGKHWEIVTILFDEKPTTEAKIKEMAQNIDIDVEKLQKDANSHETKVQLEQEIDEAMQAGITGTPAIVINGKPYTGMKLDYELEEILIKNGATRK